MPVEVRIVSLLVDPNSNLPIVVLMEVDGQRALPIVIGMNEAESIALALQSVKLPRPRTHDLMHQILMALGGTLERVIVVDLRESTFYAELELRQGAELLRVDTRPSDAIALAVRTGSPLFIAEHVMDEAHIRPHAGGSGVPASDGEEPRAPIAMSDDISPQELREMLAELGPDAFGKYKI